MRTKTLLLSAVALAAGFISANAQVYSVNVVGYVNVPLEGAQRYTLIANPLDDGNGNQISNLLATLPNKSTVTTWAGTVYNTAITKAGGAWPAGSLPPGVGFFVRNGIASSPALTNTFVGQVVVAPGGSVTNALPINYTLAGSAIPFAGDLTTDANLNLGGVLPNKSTITTWNKTGQIFNTASTKAGGTWGTPVNVTVGEGFFINAKSGTNWVQTLPANP